VFGGVRGQDVAADWRDRWKAFHQPVRVGPLWIGPPWHDPPADATAIVIDPGRAFGTGAHPTTQLCVELMLELEPASVVDFGCGSGVLSIVAAKLGFTPVIALDADENAVAATIANAAANGVEVDARQANVLDGVSPRGGGRSEHHPHLGGGARPRLRSRSLVTSGYLPTDDAALPGFRHLRRITRGGWAADHYEAT
jgi:ribosomal protein L11 methylase PrmA